MNKAIRSVAALMLLAATPAAAQRLAGSPRMSLHIPAGTQLTPAQALRISKKLNVLASGMQQRVAQHKTAVAEKMLAMSDYDFTALPAQQFLDSLRFIYDGSRGAAYDYNSLSYDLNNDADYPYNSVSVMPISGYLNYDTMRSYTPPGSSTYVDAGLRQYNIFNKVSVASHPTNPDISFFDYDPFGKLIKLTVMDNSNGVGLDSSYRDFYTYNATSGIIERDSSETWDGTAWQKEAVVEILNNAAGFPVRENVYFSTPLGNIPFATLDLAYNIYNQMLGATLSAVTSFPGPVVKYSRDTFDYTTGILTAHNSYLWDTTAHSWVISSYERRHLNTSALVDSVFTRYYTSAGAAIDSAVQRLAYNTSDHPLFQRYYSGNGTTKTAETRYYYTLPLPAGIATVKTDISVYPNPASGQLRVKGLADGQFSIVNTVGQLVVRGTLSRNASIPLIGVPAGLYQLVILDAAGMSHAVSFAKE